MPVGWDDLRVEAIAKIKGNDFEDFIREILEVETRDRHQADCNLVGPERDSVGDGGCDLYLDVSSVPQFAAEHYVANWGVKPITRDRIGRIIYSCKSGPGWKRLAQKDATGGNKRALPALRDGAFFVLVVNVPVVEPDPIRASLAKAFATRLASEGSSPEQLETLAKTLIGRVAVFDANDVRRFLQGRRPERLSARWLRELDVELPPRLVPSAQWRGEHIKDRGSTREFVADRARTELIAALQRFLEPARRTSEQRFGWLIGAAGVGKTRLVLRALEASGHRTPLADRVFFAAGFGDGERAIAEHRFEARFPGAVLVVDDCSVEDAEALLKSLRRHGPEESDGAVLVVTPAAPACAAGLQIDARFELNPLDDDACRRLLRAGLRADADDDDVEYLAALVEGYPWFATLVSEEVRAHDRAPHNLWEATRWALVSSHEEEPADRRHEELVRARSLFVVMLTEGVEWADLSGDDEAALLAGVGLQTWAEVERAVGACKRRGLVRDHGPKYVTPAILEREIARHLLAPPPDGPEPIGPRVRRYAPRFLAQLYPRLELLGVPAQTLAELASRAISELVARAPTVGDLVGAGVERAEVLFAARHCPDALLRWLGRAIEQTTPETLREQVGVRRTLVRALEEGAARSVDLSIAERALFRLVLAENEGYGNNATGVWRGLFVPEVAASEPGIVAILDRLEERCRDGDPEVRRYALTAIKVALDPRGTAFARSPDRDRPRVPDAALARARARVWRLLLDATRDTEPAIAAEACALVATSFRAALAAGAVEAAEPELRDAVGSFSDAQRRRLFVAVAEAEAYDLRAEAGRGPVVARLLAAFAPGSFREQLRQHVATRTPKAAEEALRARDEELARAGLAAPSRLIEAELPWLYSPEAGRSPSFAAALGRTDATESLRARLVADVRVGADPNVLSGYLLGRVESGDRTGVARELATWGGDHSLARARALTIARIDPDDELVALLLDDLASVHLDDAWLSLLTWGRWERVSSPTLARVVEALLARAGWTGAAVALERLDIALEHRQDGALWDLALLAMETTCLARLGAMAEWSWAQLARKYIARGAGARVRPLVMRRVLALGDDADRDTWLLAHALAEGDPHGFWAELRGGIDPRDLGHRSVAFGLRRYGIGAMLPVDGVMDWVGHDGSRGSWVAQFVPIHAPASSITTASPDDPAAEAPGPRAPSPSVRQLVDRFGARSAVGRQLIVRLYEVAGASSLAAYDATVAGTARQWLGDTSREVRAWAALVVEEFERAHRREAISEELERRRVGT